MSYFASERVNKGRQPELDWLKAFCIVCMIFLHIYEDCAIEQTGLIYHFLDYACVFTGAACFMICMGVGMRYSRKQSPADYVYRGIEIFTVGQLLNLLRNALPNLIAWWIKGEGWLHTGDMGYIDEMGYLCLSGRFKELIIRGGENIMPQEVEAAISELEIIDNVKVIGVPSDFFGEEVAACIKLKDGASFDEAAVKAELLKRLAKYKVPSFFIVYDRLPMLGSGKIDGVALKKDALEKLAVMNK